MISRKIRGAEVEKGTFPGARLYESSVTNDLREVVYSPDNGLVRSVLRQVSEQYNCPHVMEEYDNEWRSPVLTAQVGARLATRANDRGKEKRTLTSLRHVVKFLNISREKWRREVHRRRWIWKMCSGTFQLIPGAATAGPVSRRGWFQMPPFMPLNGNGP